MLRKNSTEDRIFINFTNFAYQLITEIGLTTIQKDFLSLIYSSNKMTNIFHPRIKSFKLDEYEMILYSYKCAFISSSSKPNSFYHKMFSKELVNIINSSYIPGGEPNDDLIISTYYEVKDLLQQTATYTPGYYICSCGLWYSLGRCSLPVETAECPNKNCRKIIGGKGHKLEKREGHFRV